MRFRLFISSLSTLKHVSAKRETRRFWYLMFKNKTIAKAKRMQRSTTSIAGTQSVIAVLLVSDPADH